MERMNLRGKARDEFPLGWWHSGRWWLEGARELAVNCLAALAAVCFLREALRLVRDRDSPADLARRRVPTEGWVAGLLLGCMALGSSTALAAVAAQTGSSEPGLVQAAVLIAIFWWLANVVVSVTALAVLARSRVRHRDTWAEIDFVESHAPKYGRPPETVEEYRALRLKGGRL
ncbi:hypothetical protein [Paenarthrobacter sp. YJN-5]|uniref:hypothetical protein n=1 Tax=Paenarthrobacter sp. YJN-5 TaxID=2735316 RepID=UPI00187787F0|nr:hypothetical protein [Paenarthrobacter sp. YJN-5]QOT16679.1 hypothetical protein HMI59_08760 [Paenarthrobacter sp. YJN-5]